MGTEQSNISTKTKKQYTAPRLTVYGDMEKITAGFGYPYGKPHPSCRHRRTHFYNCQVGS
jgi:hypothetical protein